jgi:hypothetical protein
MPKTLKKISLGLTKKILLVRLFIFHIQATDKFKKFCIIMVKNTF